MRTALSRLEDVKNVAVLFTNGSESLARDLKDLAILVDFVSI
jgi:hypothetical protein